MKKLLLFLTLGALSNVGFADDGRGSDSLEDIIEKRLEINFADIITNQVDIDVDVFDKYTNLNIEFDNNNQFKNNVLNSKNNDLFNLAEEMATSLMNDFNFNDVSVQFEVEKTIGNDEVIFQKTFKK